MTNNTPSSIEEYVLLFSVEIQNRLKAIIKIIEKLAPEAKQAIKYGMPTYVLNGNLIHFAAYNKHIGMYPVPKGNQKLMEVLAPYVKGKGTLQFSNKEELPLDIIIEVIKSRIIEQS